MTLSLSSKVSIASTDGLLGLALIACKPELFSSGLTISRSSSVPAKPFGTDAATRLKMCSRARVPCSPTMRVIEHAPLFKKLPRLAHKGGGLFQTAGLLEEELLQLRRLGIIEGAEPQITGDGLLMVDLLDLIAKYRNIATGSW
jgi:hypothetical protein